MRRHGRLDDALTHLHLAWGLRERIGDTAGRGMTLAQVATLHLEKGDHHGALGFAHQAMAELSRTRLLGPESEAAAVVARVHRDLGDLDAASFYADRAVDLSRRARDPLRQALAQDVLGQVRWRQGRHQEARDCWEVAHDLYHDLDDARARGIRLQLDEWVEPELSPPRQDRDSDQRSPVGEPEPTES
jgi:tetratricopeptide (TPR) repeat protein